MEKGQTATRSVPVIDGAPACLAELPAYFEGLTDAQLASSWAGVVCGIVADEALLGHEIDLGQLARVLGCVASRTRCWQRNREIPGFSRRVRLILDRHAIREVQRRAGRANRGVGRILGELIMDGLDDSR